MGGAHRFEHWWDLRPLVEGVGPTLIRIRKDGRQIGDGALLTQRMTDNDGDGCVSAGDRLEFRGSASWTE